MADKESIDNLYNNAQVSWATKVKNLKVMRAQLVDKEDIHYCTRKIEDASKWMRAEDNL